MAMHHPTSRVLRTAPAGATPRILLSALGAAGLIAAAFQSWTRDLQGADVSWPSVYRDSIGSTDDPMAQRTVTWANLPRQSV